MDPTLHLIAQVGILTGVFSGMLAVGFSVPFGEVVRALHAPRVLALALLANFVAVPIFALLLVRLLPIGVEGRTALVLLGATAGAPFLPKLSALARGYVPFSIGLMVLLMAVTVVYAPLVLPLLLPDVTVAPRQIATSLVVVMLLPLAAGLLARTRYEAIADWSTSVGHISATALAIGLAAGLLVDWRDLLSTVGSWILIGAALLALGAAFIGWLFATGEPVANRRVALLATGMRNFSAALLIADRDFGPPTLVMTMAATIVLSLVLTVLAGELGKAG